MQISSYLKKMPFILHATEEEMNAAAQQAYITHFHKGEVVHARAQAECLGAVLVLSGSLCASMISDEGRQILLYRLEEGDSCVFTARCILNMLSYDAVVEGESDGTMLVVPVEMVNQLMKNIRVENAMQRLAIQRCAQIMCALERVLFTPVDKRLALRLLQAAEKKGGWKLSLTHEQLARDISTAREVVSRTLGKFVRARLIEVCRGQIQIIDPEGLKNYNG